MFDGMTEQDAIVLESQVDATAAGEVLFFFGYDGPSPGSFMSALIDTLTKADPTNRAKLAMVYPNYASAVTLIKDVSGGVDRLKRVAGR